ncbi:type II toxin-antitoxin system VapC family toxin [Desulfatirhabdium butyrativorans]|uniref:type II toxin-antitoxin system VapC family toxin n=1 Tax=Desulfatirhabdium butyrativorans TaxID=340467 RepID=UPI000A01957A
MTLVGVESDDSEGVLANILQYSLLPRDALHLTIMQRLGITQVVSDDTDFDRVTAIERHWIINPPNPGNSN